MIAVRLTREAERDLAEIARYTVTTFGAEQALRYGALIEQALASLSQDPCRPASRDRDELRPGVRSLHLSRVAARRHAASHVLYYHVQARPDGGRDLVLLRVLHERMEPLSRLLDAISPEKDRTP